MSLTNRILVFLSVLICSTALRAQEKQVSGKVVEAVSGDPIPGMVVAVQRNGSVDLTDDNGAFTVSALPQDDVTVSCLGYKTLSVKASSIAGTPVLTVEVEVSELDATVVVGYGTQLRKSTVAAISTTKGEELLNVGNIASVSEALQGKLVGVTAVNSTSQPGNNETKLFIRGKSSWNGSDPLVLVDGVAGSLNDIDFNDIESISVLKDAAATAVYGVQGANGVIILTTKRGTASAPKVKYSMSIGLKTPTTKVEWSDYVTSMNIYNEALANDRNWDKQIPQSTIDAWKNAYATGNYGPYNDYFPEVDWYKECIKPALSQNHNVNVSGGTSFMRYFASVGYFYDGGMYDTEVQPDFDPRYYFRRFNWRTNFDFNLTPTTILSVRLAGMAAYQNECGTFRDFVNVNNFTQMLMAPVNAFPIRYSDGVYGEGPEHGYNTYANLRSRGQNTHKNSRGTYDVALEQKLDFITEGLKFSARISYTSFANYLTLIKPGMVYGNTVQQAHNASIRYYRTYDYSSPIYDSEGNVTGYPLLSETRYPNNQASELPIGVEYDTLYGYDNYLYYEAAVNYARSFGNHDVTAMGVFNRSKKEKRSGNYLDFPYFTEDWVSRLTYAYRHKYLAEFNISYTGSEKFAPGKRFGLFPSAAIGWRVSEEPWIKDTCGDILNNLKVRYSYGQSGSDQGANRFNYIQTFSESGSINFGRYSTTPYGPTYIEGDASNPNATWEVATKQNIGVELGLWNKLSVNVELYDEKRSGILMPSRLNASWYAAGLPSVNIGKTKNHGLEAEATWNDYIGKRFNYWLTLGFSTSENRIVYRQDPEGMAEYTRDAGKPIGYINRYAAVGNYGSIDDLFNYAQTAIDGTSPAKLVPGDLVYTDYNGDLQIDVNDLIVNDQLNYPLTTWSFSAGFKWKRFSGSMQWYAATGWSRNQFPQFLWDFPISNIKTQKNTLDRWTPNTANSSGVRRPSVHLDKTYHDTDNTFRCIDYSYLRLKNLEFSYNLPQSLLKRYKIQNLSLFVRGNNLLTFTKKGFDKRVDPETQGGAYYPIVRTYTFGGQITF